MRGRAVRRATIRLSSRVLEGARPAAQARNCAKKEAKAARLSSSDATFLLFFGRGRPGVAGGAMRTGKGTYPRGESQLADSTPPQHFTAVGAKRASRQRGRVEAAAAMRTWHTTSRRRCAFKRTRPCLLRSPRLIVGVGGRLCKRRAKRQLEWDGGKRRDETDDGEEWREKAAR
jgi:hypothetical protein